MKPRSKKKDDPVCTTPEDIRARNLQNFCNDGQSSDGWPNVFRRMWNAMFDPRKSQ